MGLFDIVGSLTKAVVNTVLIPVDVARDAVAVVTEEPIENTSKRIGKIGNNLSDADDELE